MFEYSNVCEQLLEQHFFFLFAPPSTLLLLLFVQPQEWVRGVRVLVVDVFLQQSPPHVSTVRIAQWVGQKRSMRQPHADAVWLQLSSLARQVEGRETQIARRHIEPRAQPEVAEPVEGV